jgi:hypothetical protein
MALRYINPKLKSRALRALRTQTKRRRALEACLKALSDKGVVVGAQHLAPVVEQFLHKPDRQSLQIKQAFAEFYAERAATASTKRHAALRNYRARRDARHSESS